MMEEGRQEDKNYQFPVCEHLGRGESEAIKSRQLTKICGYSHVRVLQSEIRRERLLGALIMSSAAGYFLPADLSDVERYVASMKSRAVSDFQVIESAKKAIERTLDGRSLYRQINIEEWLREFQEQEQTETA